MMPGAPIPKIISASAIRKLEERRDQAKLDHAAGKPQQKLSPEKSGH